MKKVRNKIIKILILMLVIIFAYELKVEATTIVLDPGHGGADPGAINPREGIIESEVTYKIAKYLKEYLEKYKDVKVIITRQENANKTIKERVDVAFHNHADLLLSLHINSSDNESATGCEGFVTYKTNFDKYNKQCTEICNRILNNISKLGIKNNGTKTRICKDPEKEWLYSDGSHADYYGIIRYSIKGTAGDGPGIEMDINSGQGIPSVLLEHCYIKNGDEKYINSNEKIKKIAKCDADALASYYNLKCKNLEPFTDVLVDSWYASAVKYCYDNNIIKGLNDTTFAPEDNLTRGMLVTILHRMEGSPYVSGKSKFSDVQDTNEYYYVAVKWATQNNIVSGYHNGKFGPNDPITREQLAVMLNQYCRYKGKYKASDTTAGLLNNFSDGAKVSNYAIYGMKWAIGSGVITGSKGRLNPQGTATRAEVASMLYKYCLNIK